MVIEADLCCFEGEAIVGYDNVLGMPPLPAGDGADSNDAELFLLFDGSIIKHTMGALLTVFTTRPLVISHT